MQKNSIGDFDHNVKQQPGDSGACEEKCVSPFFANLMSLILWFTAFSKLT